MGKIKQLFKVQGQSRFASAALLTLRVLVGVAFIMHGQSKIQAPFTWMGPDSNIPGFFQALAAISEFGGGLAFVLGLLTPLAALGIISTMAVAVYTHAVQLGHPFVSSKGGGSYELASVYLVIALLILIFGPGKFSVDRLIFGRRDDPALD